MYHTTSSKATKINCTKGYTGIRKRKRSIAGVAGLLLKKGSRKKDKGKADPGQKDRVATNCMKSRPRSKDRVTIHCILYGPRSKDRAYNS